MRDKSMDNRATSPEELLLIRTGHHLWRSRKTQEWGQEALSAALQTVWDAKKALRVELHAIHRQMLEKRAKHLEGYKWRKP